MDKHLANDYGFGFLYLRSIVNKFGARLFDVTDYSPIIDRCWYNINNYGYGQCDGCDGIFTGLEKKESKLSSNIIYYYADEYKISISFIN